jgi:hypothetical protein
MNRRGLFGAFALSPFIAINAIAKERPTGEPDSEQTRLVIHGIKKPDPSVERSGSIFVSHNEYYDPNKQVSMSVGEDGHLWIKTSDGQWKRVVTE